MTRRLTTTRVIVLAALLAVGSSACASKTIYRATADPYEFRHRDVRISGVVVDSYSLAARGVYQIRDRTGQLWVLSDRGVPRPGARVTVTGTLREAFNLGRYASRLHVPTGGVVMVESDRRVR